MRRWLWFIVWVAVSSSRVDAQALFAPRTDYTVVGATVTAVADFTGDGLPDIAVGTGSSVYLLAQNSGQQRGTFRNLGTVLSTGPNTNITAMAAGDFNEDGIWDLAITANGGGNPIMWVAGAPNGKFGTPQILFTGSLTWGSVVVGKFDGPAGHLGFAAYGNIDGPDGILYHGDGKGGFSGNAVLGGGSDTAMAVGDFNKDGADDLAIGDWVRPGGIGNPVATLDSVTTFNLVGDFDGDGRLDVAQIHNQEEVYLNIGTWTFSSALISNGAGNEAGAGVGDFNLDGKDDIVSLVAGNPSSLNVYLSNSGGTFPAPVKIPACIATNNGPSSNAVTVADLDLDGRLDVIVACNTGNTVSVYLNPKPLTLLQTSTNPSAPGQSVTLTAMAGSIPYGSLYASGYAVQFYDGSSVLNVPTPLTNGQVTFTTSQLSPGIHYLRAVLLNPQGLSQVSSSAVVVQVVSAASCAQNVNAQVNLAPGGLRRNPTTGQYTQTVTIANTSQSAITGPLSLALDNLPAGVTALNTVGVTACTLPAGAPLVDLGMCPGAALGPGQSSTFTLTFSDPQNKAITYTPVALAGYAPR